MKEGLLLVFRTRQRSIWQQEEDDEEDEDGFEQKAWIGHDHDYCCVYNFFLASEWMDEYKAQHFK